MVSVPPLMLLLLLLLLLLNVSPTCNKGRR
eukprot:COSAG02_NODE_591_length_19862_cov_8.047918_20_plen_30_part_00